LTWAEIVTVAGDGEALVGIRASLEGEAIREIFSNSSSPCPFGSFTKVATDDLDFSPLVPEPLIEEENRSVFEIEDRSGELGLGGVNEGDTPGLELRPLERSNRPKWEGNGEILELEGRAWIGIGGDGGVAGLCGADEVPRAEGVRW
jgi:hypothetical protein